MTNNNNLLIVEMSSSQLKVTDTENKDYILEGIFGQIDQKNKNNRIYTESEYVPQIEALQDKIKSSKLLGELDHPQQFDISLKSVSHIIEELYYDKESKEVRGKIRLLDTDAGRQAKALVDAGVPLQISSRAAGAVESNGKVKIKQLFTYDLVADPGFANAELKRVNESYGYDETEGLWIYEMNGENQTTDEVSNEITETNIETNNNKNMAEFVKAEDFNKYSEYLANEMKSIKESIGATNEDETLEDVKSHNDHIVESVNTLSEYVEYLAGKLDESIQYSEHVAEKADQGISYTEAVAEKLDQGIQYSEHLAESISKVKDFADHIAESNNEGTTKADNLLAYVDYLKENLQSVSEYAEYIASSINESLVEETVEEVEETEEVEEADEAHHAEEEIEEGNEFGAARAEAIAKGEKTFKVGDEEYPVEDVSKDDKENAEEFVEETEEVAEEDEAGEGAEEVVEEDEVEETEEVEEAEETEEVAEEDEAGEGAEEVVEEDEVEETEEVEEAEETEEVAEEDEAGEGAEEVVEEEDPAAEKEEADLEEVGDNSKEGDVDPKGDIGEPADELEDETKDVTADEESEEAEAGESDEEAEGEDGVHDPLESYKNEIASKLDALVEAAQVKENEAPAFLNVVSNSIQESYNTLNEDAKSEVRAKVAKRSFMNEAQISAIIENAEAVVEAKNSEPFFMTSAPAEYKEKFQSLTEAKQTQIKAQAKYHTLNTEYQVRNFWETRDLREVKVDLEKLAAVNESVKTDEVKPLYDVSDMAAALNKRFKK